MTEQEQQNMAEEQPQMTEVVIKVPSRLRNAVQNIGSFIKSLFTGEVVTAQSVTKGYDYLFYMALLLLINIVLIFSSLHQQIRANKLEKEVALMHERAIRMQEQRVISTTHSAISNELQRRGIELYDATEPVTIVE